jgi:hypothetical protein
LDGAEEKEYELDQEQLQALTVAQDNADKRANITEEQRATESDLE